MRLLEREFGLQEVADAGEPGAFNVDDGQFVRAIRAKVHVEPSGIIVPAVAAGSQKGPHSALVRSSGGLDENGEIGQDLVRAATQEEIVLAVEADGGALRGLNQMGPCGGHQLANIAFVPGGVVPDVEWRAIGNAGQLLSASGSGRGGAGRVFAGGIQPKLEAVFYWQLFIGPRLPSRKSGR